MTKLLIATRNAHKVGEIRAILGDQTFLFLTLKDFPGAPEVLEDATTFSSNATKKAVELARWLSRHSPSTMHPSEPAYVLADDSGLEVDALGGAPGVHSARFAALDSGKAGNSSDAQNNAKLLRLLKDIPTAKRTARFHCVLALTPTSQNHIQSSSPVCYADEFELQTEVFEGVCEGKIVTKPRGDTGFGYDPLFVPDGSEQSYAELGDHAKNAISHRARALEKLRARLHALTDSAT